MAQLDLKPGTVVACYSSFQLDWRIEVKPRHLEQWDGGLGSNRATLGKKPNPNLETTCRYREPGPLASFTARNIAFAPAISPTMFAHYPRGHCELPLAGGAAGGTCMPSNCS